ncbi:MAG: DNA adenine methylase [Methyloceanibacter sp.]
MRSKAKTNGDGSDTAEPFLRWAGSKRQLVPVLKEYWQPTFTRYVEPFVGSGCLFFAIAPTDAVLGDTNKELIRMYRQVRYNSRAVAELLVTMRRNKAAYYAFRAMDVGMLSMPQLAARFIYLNRFCFNGLYRTNKQGRFNVPFGAKKSGELPSIDLLGACAKRLRRASLVAGDFESVLDTTRPGDFVYMDPPYRVTAVRTFRQYSESSFTESDIARLKKRMLDLERRKVAFLVSYVESPEGKFLAKGFRVRLAEARRNIAGFSGSRGPVREMLISWP